MRSTYSRKAGFVTTVAIPFLVASVALAGNGHGNSGGNGGSSGGGNGNSSAHASSNSSSNSGQSANNGAGNGNANAANAESSDSKGQGSLHSGLGALNAAHASTQAFAHASPNSRIGKLKSYYLAEVAAQGDQAKIQTDQAAVTSALAALTALNNANPPADPQAITDAQNLYDNAVKALESDTATAQAALADANAKLSLAANKTPVSAQARQWLDNMLAGKIASN